MTGSIGPLSSSWADSIVDVINDAARRYEGAIPDDRYNEPYTSRGEVEAELAQMAWFGRVDDELVGVVGVQDLEAVTLIRHLYVREARQREGIGSKLLKHAIVRASHDEILVGTWAAAEWAIRFYEHHGFDHLGRDRTLLETHWEIPDRQVETSVVLRFRR